jgi:hypothetical protein
MQLPEAFRRLPRPSSALKPGHPPDSVACRAYSVTLQCLFSVRKRKFLACVRLSLRADKSSLHPLLLTLGVRSCTYVCGDLFDHVFDRQLPYTQFGKYKRCYIGVFVVKRGIIFISTMLSICFCGLVSWRTASGMCA